MSRRYVTKRQAVAWFVAAVVLSIPAGVLVQAMRDPALAYVRAQEMPAGKPSLGPLKGWKS